jgi:hypothetical protein
LKEIPGEECGCVLKRTSSWSLVPAGDGLPTIPKHDNIVKTLKILSLKILNPKNLNNIVLYLLLAVSKNPNTILNPKNPKPAKKIPNCWDLFAEG